LPSFAIGGNKNENVDLWPHFETLTGDSVECIKPVQNSVLQPCDEAEIINIVKVLSSNKAVGFDDKSPNIIQSIIPSIVNH